MRLNLKQIYSSKIISIFYILLPIIELITTFTIINSNASITPGMIYKSIFTVYSVVYLLFLDNKNKKVNYMLLLPLFIYTLISFFVTISSYTIINILSKIVILSRFICFPIITLFLYRFVKNGNKLNTKIILYSAGIYGLAMFLAGITGTALASYSQGLDYGNCGWFYSGNEISNLLSMFYPILIYYTAKDKTPSSILSLAFVTYGLMVIGTKTSLFAFVIVTSTMFIFFSIVYAFKRSNTSKNICIVCIILGIFYLFIIPFTPAYKYMMLRYNDAQTIINAENEGKDTTSSLDRFIYNGREIDLQRQKKIYKKSTISEKIFGINDNTKTLTATGDFNIIERDFYDVLFIHGILGLLVFLTPLLLALYSFIKHILKDFKQEINSNKFALGSSIAIAIGISHIAGHVFLASTVAIYLAFICVKLSIKEQKPSKKKSMIIYMPKLSAGGMEISLINLLNTSQFIKKFNVTLCLGYVTEIQYLNNLPKDIEIRVMTKGKFDKWGKLICSLKYIVEFIRCLDKYYDMSICYSYHHRALSILTRLSSKNTVLFMHTDLINSRTSSEINKLNKKVEFEQFKAIVCVSNVAKDAMLKLYPNYKGEIFIANNYIDGERVLKLSNQNIATSEIEKNVPIFINVSRHFEKAKKISRIIEVAKSLKAEGYIFKLWLIGDGEDTEDYKKLVEKYELRDIVIFKGKQTNPYKYIVKSNCLVVSSDFEGYGIVIDEARVLNIPIISTEVGDAKKILNQGYGIICDKSYNGLYNAMKGFLDNGYKIKQKFNYKKFNDNIDKNLSKLEQYFDLYNKRE